MNHMKFMRYPLLSGTSEYNFQIGILQVDVRKQSTTKKLRKWNLYEITS